MRARAELARQQTRGQRERLTIFHERLRRAMDTLQGRRAERLAGLAQLFGSLGYRSVLARGFALVRDREGRPLHRAAGIAPGQALTIEFSDERLDAIAGTGGGGSAAVPAEALKPLPGRGRNPRGAGGGGQGTLF